MMIRLIAALLGIWVCAISAYAQFQAFPPGMFVSRAPLDAASGGGCSPGTHAAAFIARRTGGVDTSSAFCNLINGLDTDSLFAKFDFFYVFATDTQANALLNLVSSSFNPTITGAPTFTANAGFTGTDTGGASSNFLDSTFNASTAAGQYAQDSAHVSVWSNTTAASVNGGIAIGMSAAGFANFTAIYPRFSTANTFYSINENSINTGVANADGKGHYLSNRSGASASQGYKNGANVISPNTASQSLPNVNTYITAINTAGTGAQVGDGHQIMAATMGSSLSSTDVSNLCHRLNLYLTTIAGLGAGIC